MKTGPACLPCFRRQASYAAGLATADPELRQEIIAQALALIENFDHALSPPCNAVAMYDAISRLAGTSDLFAALKEQSNSQALAYKESIQRAIRTAPDPLFAAVRFAIAGNIIDYGSHQHFDLEKTLTSCLQTPMAIDDYALFAAELHEAKSILYLGDNCGELVFDRLLIEQLPAPVTLAVKERPILNDALPADAAACGFEMTEVISNGTGCPGTPLDQCSPAFLERFHGADMVISKGQGNFETLSDCPRPIFFLFTVKCEVVAAHATALAKSPRPLRIGDTVLMRYAGM